MLIKLSQGVIHTLLYTVIIGIRQSYEQDYYYNRLLQLSIECGFPHYRRCWYLSAHVYDC